MSGIKRLFLRNSTENVAAEWHSHIVTVELYKEIVTDGCPDILT